MDIINQNLVHAPSAGMLADYPLLDNLQVANVHLVLIPWNIFLALLPAVLGWYLLRRYSSVPFTTMPSGIKCKLSALALLWLIIYPNSIYLISEARKILVYTSPTNLPYSASIRHIWRVYFIFAYSLIGWAGFAFSLGQIRRLTTRLFSPRTGWATVIILVPVGALGTFLGLFNRWNIWEATTHPLFILRDGVEHLSDPVRLFNLAAISLVLYFLYLLGEILFWTAGRRDRAMPAKRAGTPRRRLRRL
jgi:uncharacterized membrane protein